MKLKTIIVFVLAVAVSGCAGRKPSPVTEIQDGDARLSCSELAEEITINNQAILALAKESDQKAVQNVVAGAAGALVFFPALFFMDVKGASGEEMRAYQRRNEGLIQRYNLRGCKPEIKSVEIAKPAPNQNSGISD